ATRPPLHITTIAHRIRQSRHQIDDAGDLPAAQQLVGNSFQISQKALPLTERQIVDVVTLENVAPDEVKISTIQRHISRIHDFKPEGLLAKSLGQLVLHSKCQTARKSARHGQLHLVSHVGSSIFQISDWPPGLEWSS